MSSWSLPARICCAVAALPVVGVAGFYVAFSLLPKFEGADADSFGMFKTALAIGAVAAFTVSMIVLTLPGLRRRRYSGRKGRAVFSAVFVGIVCVGFAAEGHPLWYDLALLAWLSYTMAYTYVRYGVLDSPRRTATPARVS